MQTENALLALGYTQKWIDYDFLNPAFLDVQIKDHLATEHSSTEHYRYGAFISWIKAHNDHAIQDNDFTRFLELAQEDPDLMMAGSALKELLKTGQLTADQIMRIEALVPDFGPWLQRCTHRALLLHHLKRQSDNPQLIEKCMQSTDHVVQEYLLCHIPLSVENILILIEKGANKSIRNRAKQLFKNNQR